MVPGLHTHMLTAEEIKRSTEKSAVLLGAPQCCLDLTPDPLFSLPLTSTPADLEWVTQPDDPNGSELPEDNSGSK